MKRQNLILLFIFSLILVSSSSYSQKIKRDPDSRKDYANVFYKTEYTLFDLLTDEPIFVGSDGNFHIYYATNEDKVPKKLNCSPEELTSNYVYKFKNYQNCVDWCRGKTFNQKKSKSNSQNNQSDSYSEQSHTCSNCGRTFYGTGYYMAYTRDGLGIYRSNSDSQELCCSESCARKIMGY